MAWQGIGNLSIKKRSKIKKKLKRMSSRRGKSEGKLRIEV